MQSWFLGMMPLASWVFTQWSLSLVIFLLWVNKHSSTTISTFFSLRHILLNENVFIKNCFIFYFPVKNNKKINKLFNKICWRGDNSGYSCWRLFNDPQEEKYKWKKPLSDNLGCMKNHPQKLDHNFCQNNQPIVYPFRH